MKKSQKIIIIKLVISVVLGIGLYFLPIDNLIKLLLYIIPYLIIGFSPIKKAIINIAHGQVFDENFLMTIATIGAFAIGEYIEALAVMVLYQIGQLFESIAVGNARNEIASLVDLQVETVNLEKDGQLEVVDPYEVSIGDIIVVLPGEKVPLDGIIIEGESSIDTSALTGESVPRGVKIGDKIYSGSLNQQKTIKIEVTSEYDDSTAAKILSLIENSSMNKAKSESFITKFAKVYTPVVVAMAVVLAVVPSILLGDVESWIHRALSFLVVSCPCAFVISVPLTFFAGLGSASKNGVLIKGSNFVEALSNAKVAIFDKTGTLTKGVFSVVKVEAKEDKDKLLEIAAYTECLSTHPIAKSILDSYGKNIDFARVGESEQLSGLGVKTIVDNSDYYCGNQKLMDILGFKVEDVDIPGSIVYVASKENYFGYIVISDIVKDESKQTIEYLKKNNIFTVMLSGDNEKSANAISNHVGIDKCYYELLPQDKLNEFNVIKNGLNSREKTIYVGDGINDVPVLANADVGIAMGALGSDAAIETADVVIMNDDISKIIDAHKISKKTMRIVYENIIFALLVKVVILILGALGITGMWAAIFADVGVTVIAVLNAIRAMKK